tara:strand:- start:1935 stop:2477 length:543 start_codon:yes stop_codon:yes gene_type:complete
METEQNRYARGKIYSIRSHQTNDIYIGSTIDTLPKRLYQHKTDYKSFIKQKKHYKTSFEIIPYEDCYIELIENFPCNSKTELERKEGEHIRAIQCVNKVIAGRTKKERYQDKKEQILLKVKEYAKTHKTQIALKDKHYRETHKEQIALKRKIYRETHKEQIALRKKEYYLKKKASLNLIS